MANKKTPANHTTITALTHALKLKINTNGASKGRKAKKANPTLAKIVEDLNKPDKSSETITLLNRLFERQTLDVSPKQLDELVTKIKDACTQEDDPKQEKDALLNAFQPYNIAVLIAGRIAAHSGEEVQKNATERLLKPSLVQEAALFRFCQQDGVDLKSEVKAYEAYEALRLEQLGEYFKAIGTGDKTRETIDASYAADAKKAAANCKKAQKNAAKNTTKVKAGWADWRQTKLDELQTAYIEKYNLGDLQIPLRDTVTVEEAIDRGMITAMLMTDQHTPEAFKNASNADRDALFMKIREKCEAVAKDWGVTDQNFKSGKVWEYSFDSSQFSAIALTYISAYPNPEPDLEFTPVYNSIDGVLKALDKMAKEIKNDTTISPLENITGNKKWRDDIAAIYKDIPVLVGENRLKETFKKIKAALAEKHNVSKMLPNGGVAELVIFGLQAHVEDEHKATIRSNYGATELESKAIEHFAEKVGKIVLSTDGAQKVSGEAELLQEAGKILDACVTNIFGNSILLKAIHDEFDPAVVQAAATVKQQRKERDEVTEQVEQKDPSTAEPGDKDQSSAPSTSKDSEDKKTTTDTKEKMSFFKVVDTYVGYLAPVTFIAGLIAFFVGGKKVEPEEGKEGEKTEQNWGALQIAGILAAIAGIGIGANKWVNHVKKQKELQGADVPMVGV